MPPGMAPNRPPQPGAGTANLSDHTKIEQADVQMHDGTSSPTKMENGNGSPSLQPSMPPRVGAAPSATDAGLASSQPAQSNGHEAQPSAAATAPYNGAAQADGQLIQPMRQPAEVLEEIVSMLKTAFPLLALNLETFADQMLQRFKNTKEEDLYRFTSVLLADAVQVC